MGPWGSMWLTRLLSHGGCFHTIQSRKSGFRDKTGAHGPRRKFRNNWRNFQSFSIKTRYEKQCHSIEQWVNVVTRSISALFDLHDPSFIWHCNYVHSDHVWIISKFSSRPNQSWNSQVIERTRELFYAARSKGIQSWHRPLNVHIFVADRAFIVQRSNNVSLFMGFRKLVYPSFMFRKF